MLKLARIAVAFIFAATGILFSTWSIHIPTVQRQLGLSEGILGTLLLTMAVGSVGVMPFVGNIISRVTSRRVMLFSAFGMLSLVPLLLLAPSLWVLVPLMVCFGIVNGAIDVSMNTQAVTIEQRYHKPIMSSFHGWFSVGGLIGAGFGSLLLKLGVTPIQHIMIVSSGMLGLLMIAQRYLLHEDPPSAEPTPMFVLPKGILIPLGLLALVDLVAEGAMIDWTAVYLRNWLDSSAAVAGLGFAAFSLTMAVARFTGDYLVARVGRVRLISGSAWFAALGLTIGIMLSHPLAAIIGFGCVGFGLANVIPVLFNAAGRVPNIASGTALAAITTTGYTGFFIGPPLVGWTAEALNLPAAMLLVAGCCAIVAWWSPRVLRQIDAETIPNKIEASA